MTNRLPIQRCQYCGCEDIGLGWQHGEALVTFKKHGMLGNRLRYLICRRCGAVLYRSFPRCFLGNLACPPQIRLSLLLA